MWLDREDGEEEGERSGRRNASVCSGGLFNSDFEGIEEGNRRG